MRPIEQPLPRIIGVYPDVEQAFVREVVEVHPEGAWIACVLAAAKTARQIRLALPGGERFASQATNLRMQMQSSVLCMLDGHLVVHKAEPSSLDAMAAQWVRRNDPFARLDIGLSLDTYEGALRAACATSQGARATAMRLLRSTYREWEREWTEEWACGRCQNVHERHVAAAVQDIYEMINRFEGPDDALQPSLDAYILGRAIALHAEDTTHDNVLSDVADFAVRGTFDDASLSPRTVLGSMTDAERANLSDLRAQSVSQPHPA